MSAADTKELAEGVGQSVSGRVLSVINAVGARACVYVSWGGIGIGKGSEGAQQCSAISVQCSVLCVICLWVQVAVHPPPPVYRCL